MDVGLRVLVRELLGKAWGGMADDARRRL
jgi:hypothetical protein